MSKFWNDLQAQLNENELIEIDALLLAARFLSIIDDSMEQQGITRKELADKIEVSPSYLTQLFRGNRIPNFKTLAKIQKVLNLKFEVRIKPTPVPELTEELELF